jgi:hypothetical protein
MNHLAGTGVSKKLGRFVTGEKSTDFLDFLQDIAHEFSNTQAKLLI